MKRVLILSVNVLLKDKLSDEPLHLWSLPLRSHMPSIMDSCKHEVTVFSDMSWEGSVCSPGPLSLRLLEISIFNPALGSVRWHSTISCSRVMQYSVLILHFLVYPNWRLQLRSVVFEYLIVANFKGLHTIRDVEGLSHLRLVQVLCDEWSGACRVAAEIESVLELGSELLERQVFVSFKDGITFV